MCSNPAILYGNTVLYKPSNSHQTGVEEAKGPVGTVSVGGEGRGCRVGVFAHHGVGCVGMGRLPPEDRGEDEEGEKGGPGPP